ncbi:MAG: hypothetical protein HON65_07980, partial [Rhodospirillales bacterium]|nr:hypothetical protein [Rhodospirillales bacterium]
MGGKSEENNVVSDEAITKIRNHFLGWQCRLRQFSVRDLNGEPSKGMRPDIAIGDTGAGYEAVT